MVRVSKCPSFKNVGDCGEKGGDICAWNSKTNKCRKKRVTRKRTPDLENCPRLKTSDGCGKNELCKWNSKTSKCRKMRVVVSKRGKKINYPIAFLFTIIGGKKDAEEDEDKWKDFPANKLSKEAKETFKLGVVDQLSYYLDNRTDTLKYTFKKEGLVARTTVDFDYRADSEETEELMDFVAVMNEKSIWQTHFKYGELDVVSDGKYYKFWDMRVL